MAKMTHNEFVNEVFDITNPEIAARVRRGELPGFPDNAFAVGFVTGAYASGATVQEAVSAFLREAENINEYNDNDLEH